MLINGARIEEGLVGNTTVLNGKTFLSIENTQQHYSDHKMSGYSWLQWLEKQFNIWSNVYLWPKRNNAEVVTSL